MHIIHFFTILPYPSLYKPPRPRYQTQKSQLQSILKQFKKVFIRKYTPLIMAVLKLVLLLLVLSLSLSLSPVFCDTENMKYWCSKTPNPETCEYFSTQKSTSSAVKNKSDFRKMAVEIALERATLADGHTKGLGSKCRNEKEKAAWADCVELYDITIAKLNETIDPSRKCSDVEAQTWLSASLANLETCRTGFMELGVSDYMLPMMTNNVSKLICNSLAINKVPPSQPQYKAGFPSWVKPGDRKLLQTASPTANIVVAQDGSGNVKTIKEAIDAATKRKGTGRFVIKVNAGTYKENVVIGKKVKNVMLIGDGIGKTIITGSKSVGGGTTTFNSATFGVVGDGFVGRGITFRNTAGAANHQAVAMRSGSDLSVFYQCSFEGYQDTLYVHSQRQFYKACDIYGTVDFIFGDAAAVLQNCNIYPRRPMAQQKNTITAQGRSDPNENTGISIHNSRITPSSDLKPVVGQFKTYLGRPWKQYSRTVYLQTFMDSLITPAGWLEWDGNFALNTLFYGEYKNTGPGASTSGRVKWGGHKVITSATEASKFSVASFISGGSWLPNTGVPFTSSL